MPEKPIPLSGRQNADRDVENAVSFLESVLTGYHPRDFAIRLWNGSGIGPEQGEKTRGERHVRCLLWHNRDSNPYDEIDPLPA